MGINNRLIQDLTEALSQKRAAIEELYAPRIPRLQSVYLDWVREEPIDEIENGLDNDKERAAFEAFF